MSCFGCDGLAPMPEPKDEGILKNIIFKEGTRMKITEKTDGLNRIVQFDVLTQVDPVVTLVANPAQAEVGQTVNVTFTGTITPGSDPIVSRTLTGSDNPTTDAFSVTVEGVTSNLNKTLVVTDKGGVVKQVTAGVRFLSRFYIVYSHKQILGAEDVVGYDGALAGSTDQAFGGEKKYNIPATGPGGKDYIFWVYPTTMMPIGVPVLGGLQVPLEKQANTIIINGISYYVERTKNNYGQSDLTITI
jgi:hypothetical protein